MAAYEINTPAHRNSSPCAVNLWGFADRHFCFVLQAGLERVELDFYMKTFHNFVCVQGGFADAHQWRFFGAFDSQAAVGP